MHLRSCLYSFLFEDLMDELAQLKGIEPKDRICYSEIVSHYYLVPCWGGYTNKIKGFKNSPFQTSRMAVLNNIRLVVLTFKCTFQCQDGELALETGSAIKIRDQLQRKSNSPLLVFEQMLVFKALFRIFLVLREDNKN